MAQDSSLDPNRKIEFSRLQVCLAVLTTVCLVVPIAIGNDGPPDDDPSHWTDLVVGTHPHDGPEHMNEGAFEGGPTGTEADAYLNNSAPDADEGHGKYRIPTGGKPSPLFGAGSFEQQVLRFEEFGTRELPTGYDNPRVDFPAPVDPQTCPDGVALDDFLEADLAPQPGPSRDEGYINSWRGEIESYLGHTLDRCPGDGRPPGEGWSAQRYEELAPVRYFESVQTGARVNRGARNAEQTHRYMLGEFGPGGLYHNATGTMGFEGTTEGVEPRFHPSMPIQEPLTFWTFDGTFPPKLLCARYGRSILFRHWNGLPIDISANRGFGCHTITTHDHNGHNPAESDGNPNAFFFPGQFYDYNWPMILAGNDSINTDALESRAGFPDGNGGIVNIPGDFRETVSTHWLHDQMLDFTAQNIYKGNVAMMNYYSSIDRGNEVLEDGVNLRLPSGSALDWGNRDYDVNLMISGKAWDEEGQLWFNPFQTKGMLGDRLLTNWLYHPYLDVRARRYRLRILNSSVARFLKLALVVERTGDIGELSGPEGSGISYDRAPFHMIANDGNLMGHAIVFDGTLGTGAGVLPLLAASERYDIIVDFSRYQPGDRLYLVNLQEHRNGGRTERMIPLRRVLNERYKAVTVDEDADGVVDQWRRGDPTVGRFLEFRVHAMAPGQDDPSLDPTDYEPGKQVLVEQPVFPESELDDARHRDFRFGRSFGTDEAPWTIKTKDGAFQMDPRRITAAPQGGTTEVWTLTSGGGWSHPVNIHLEEGKILSRDGAPPPIWEQYARKDVYRVGPMPDSSKKIVVALRFREFNGSYTGHSHNATQADSAMMMRWDVEFPDQVNLMPSPLPTWSGCKYADSFALNHFRTGDGGLDTGNGQGHGGGDKSPTAMKDFARAIGQTPVEIHLTANDYDDDGDLDVESVVITTPPVEGTVEVLGGGWVRYTAVRIVDFTDTFEYTVSDTAGNKSDRTVVSIAIDDGDEGGDEDPGEAPVAHFDQVSTPVGQAVELDPTDNDTDADGDLDASTLVITQAPIQGTVEELGNGRVRYTPTVQYQTSDSFNYTVSDAAGNVSNVATVLVSITDGSGGGGSAPVAVYDDTTTPWDQAVEIDLTANDFDADGDLDVSTLVITQLPAKGTLELLGSGLVRYTPAVDVDTSDTFNYTVSDLAGNVSNVATVQVMIDGDG